MSNKKLTDNEIIKALEYCKDCSANLNVEIIDFITRQQVELENLKVENQSLRSAANSLKMHYEEAQAEIERLESANDEKFRQWDMLAEKTKQHYANLYEEAKDILKAEAIKAFAERLKEKAMQKFDWNEYVEVEDIDNLVKEMVGENNDS